jgi:hypothetical protein
MPEALKCLILQSVRIKPHTSSNDRYKQKFVAGNLEYMRTLKLLNLGVTEVNRVGS